ncbi:MAG: carboxypeptidase regulatory-like domain-containing protein [Pyrinomonadaceae bacterium]
MIKSWSIRGSLVFSLLVVFAAAAFSQGTTTRITGVVTDPQSAPVSGATVTLQREGGGALLSTQSASNGSYVFDLIQAGVYEITVEKTGFNKIIAPGNTALVNQPATANFTLVVGDVSATVTVIGAVEQVQTSTSGNSGTTIEERAVESLPIVGTRGRNPLDLLNFQPGVANGANTGGGVHIHGSRDRSFNFTLDGIDINESTAGGSNFTPLRPNPESIREFQIVTANSTAELGRSSGAQVTFVTRSGTNEFHGNIFDYYQTPRFNAKSYSETINRLNKGQFVQHIYGGSFGGPLFYPKPNDSQIFRLLKDKAFFFVNLQLLRASDSAAVTRTVYTPQARLGLFRYVVGRANAPAGTATAAVDATGNPILPACVGSPPTNQPCITSYNGAVSAPNSFDPYLVGLINSMPLPNNFTAGDGLNTAGYSWSAPGNEKQIDFVTKFDFILNEKNAFYVRYGYGDQNSIGDGGNGGRKVFPDTPRLVDTFRSPRNLAANWRFSPTPKFTNEFIWGRSTFAFSFDTPEPDLNYRFAFINPSDFNFNDSFNARGSTTYQYVDNMTFDLSPHTVKTGINFRLNKHLDDRYSVAGSTIEGKTPLSSAASLFTTYGLPVAGTNSIAGTDLTRLRGTLTDLIGHLGTLNRAFVLDPANPSTFAPGGTRWINEAHYNEYDFYVQDSWRMRPNFVLDLGVRWEVKVRPKVNGRPILVPDQSVKIGAAPTNSLRWVEGDLFGNEYGLILPSVGFAWDPFKKGKTSIRANYRMATDRFATFLFGSSIFQGTPGNNTSSTNSAFGQGGGLLRNSTAQFDALFPTISPDQLRQPPALSSNALSVIDPDLTYPQVHSFLVSFQQEIGKANVFEFNYIRKQAVHLLGGYNANQVNLQNIRSNCPNENFLTAFRNAQANMASCLIPFFRTTSGAQYTLASFRTEFSSDLVGNNVAGVAQTLARRSGSSSLTAAGFDPFFFMQYPQFAGGFNVIDSSDYSKYNGLEFIFKRRLNAGLSFQASYTWAESKDNRSFDPTFTTVSSGAAQSAGNTPFDNDNRDLNFSWSDFDRRHVFQSTWVYELPFGHGRKFKTGNSFADYVIGGWQFAGTFLWQSGRPFTVFSGFNTSTNAVQSTANCNGCPRNLGSLVLESGRNFWFDSAARALFSNPATGENGNTGRNYFLTPGYIQPDVSLLRKFRFTERFNLDFRVDARNVLNHPNFDLPTATVTSGTFGRINDGVTNTARRIQLSLKLNF